MTDRILSSGWWLVLMSMIGIATGVTLFVGYQGLFDLLAARWVSGAIAMGVSFVSGFAALMLCRHRNDLL